jgi:photosystem II stability/assembly factor-like uncharacterized protein
MRQTEQINTSPGVFFLDAANGWITYAQPLGERTVIQTHDGGRTWRDVSLTSPVFPVFGSDRRWYAIRQGKFLKTLDGGRTWQESRVPHLGSYDAVKFLSPDIGWIVSLANASFTVFRTNDGGLVWNESRTEVPKDATHLGDVFFLDQHRGWLITWHSSGGSYLFATRDGGKNWAPEPDRSFQGAHRWANCVRFLSDRLGFIFEDEDPPGRDSQWDETVVRLSNLLYTSDGGSHWHKLALPNHVSGCQVFDGDLLCTASGKSSGLIVLTVHPERGERNAVTVGM